MWIYFVENKSEIILLFLRNLTVIKVKIWAKFSAKIDSTWGHAQTMWTAMGGGGVHEMSTLLIKLI